jgi:hypothetical protein
MNTEIETTELECGLTRIDNAWTCEECEGVFVGEHFSAEDCNATGDGVTLCHECCEAANATTARRLAEGGPQPLQPIVIADDDVIRFRANAILRWAVDSGKLNLNEIACLPGISNADRCQLSQLIGYSISGYGDLSYVDGAEWARVQAAKLATLGSTES